MKENEIWRIQQVNLSRLGKSSEKDLDPHKRFRMRSLVDVVAVERGLFLYRFFKILLSECDNLR